MFNGWKQGSLDVIIDLLWFSMLSCVEWVDGGVYDDEGRLNCEVLGCLRIRKYFLDSCGEFLVFFI